jgi:glyoxylase-like metal-dependent hydrolase (beta-lactamase superfamily II)
MKIRALLISGITATVLTPGLALAQATGSTATAGPRSFAQWDKIEITVETKYGNNLAILHGSPGLDTTHPDAAGGRVMVLYGPDGILMVDSQDEELTQKTIDCIRTLSKEPIRILVTSHAHPDHSGGMAIVQKQGAVLFGQEDLRREMMPAGSPANATTGAMALPMVTYKYDPVTKGKPAVTISMNGETVDFIPMMPSHLAGDTIIRFRNANVIYIEDFYRNFGYPFADQANGGSINGMVEAIDMMGSLSDDNTVLVPGHGTLIHKKDLLPYRAMLLDILAKVKTLVDQGKTLEEVLAANLTAPYDANTAGDDPNSIRRYITETFFEVKGLPPLVNGRRTMPSPAATRR